MLKTIVSAPDSAIANAKLTLKDKTSFTSKAIFGKVRRGVNVAPIQSVSDSDNKTC